MTIATTTPFQSAYIPNLRRDRRRAGAERSASRRQELARRLAKGWAPILLRFQASVMVVPQFSFCSGKRWAVCTAPAGARIRLCDGLDDAGTEAELARAIAYLFECHGSEERTRRTREKVDANHEALKRGRLPTPLSENK